MRSRIARGGALCTRNARVWVHYLPRVTRDFLGTVPGEGFVRPFRSTFDPADPARLTLSSAFLLTLVCSVCVCVCAHARARVCVRARVSARACLCECIATVKQRSARANEHTYQEACRCPVFRTWKPRVATPVCRLCLNLEAYVKSCRISLRNSSDFVFHVSVIILRWCLE